MPTNPPVIYVPPSAGSPPAAPGGIYTPPSAGSPPPAPGGIYTPPSGAGAPTAPRAIYTPPSAGSPPASPGGIFSPPVPGQLTASPGAIYSPPGGNLTVSGTMAPDARGIIVRVAAPDISIYPGGEQWSTDGSAEASDRKWVGLVRYGMVTTTDATVEALAPKAGYTPGANMFLGSGFGVTDPATGVLKTYFLYTNGGSPIWVISFTTGPDKGAILIPAGSIITGAATRTNGGFFIGGLLATWRINPATRWAWRMDCFGDSAVYLGSWLGIGTQPITATWTGYSPATGAPVVTTGSVSIPPVITIPPANGGAVSPPPAIFVP